MVSPPSPLVSLLVALCWMVCLCLPEVFSPLVARHDLEKADTPSKHTCGESMRDNGRQGETRPREPNTGTHVGGTMGDKGTHHPNTGAHAGRQWERTGENGRQDLGKADTPSSTFLLVYLSWMVCPPSRVLSPLVSHCVPLSPHVCACVGRCARLPEVSPCPLVSPHVCLCWMVCSPSQGEPLPPCLPTCVPVLDGVSAFPRSCLSLSPHIGVPGPAPGKR